MGSNASTLATVDAGLLSRAQALVSAPPSSPPRAAQGRHPDTVFREVAAQPYPVYLWGDPQHETGRYSIVTHSPYAVLREDQGQALLCRGDASLKLPVDGVELATRLIAATPQTEASPVPFAGGAVGYISYEHGLHYLNPARARPQGPLPAYHFAFYDHAYVFDHREGKGYFSGRAPRPRQTITSPERPESRVGTWRCAVDSDQYLRNVERILEHIGAGDIYQANYTVRFEAAGQVDPAHLALQLRALNPSPQGAFLGFPGGSIWSCSPELLIAGEREGIVTSRPIKGTRGRGVDALQDERLRSELCADPKERAELLMIVDLVRNDLGRVAECGSVHVDSLYRVESYANVHHLEATVSARLRRGVHWHTLLGALLPGGSVTGAPKRRATDLLQEVETVPRSVYTGAIGYLSTDGHANFNLPIRTLYHDGETFYLHSGGGIVADSSPEREWAEVHVKVANIRSILAGVCKHS